MPVTCSFITRDPNLSLAVLLSGKEEACVTSLYKGRLQLHWKAQPAQPSCTWAGNKLRHQTKLEGTKV